MEENNSVDGVEQVVRLMGTRAYTKGNNRTEGNNSLDNGKQ
jgi:hypothetical protein